ncbi:hypothetical protein CALVIDRAFT_41237 [Calocera viscosa TUFC12733]|uniref:Uncharacterized protein n=1 Tax=Calocera viscosa (strain TUFC12733) TaxID=1330018 RepID=A0A167P2W9_CALVF|nr:hypothetical protein CALVIDRAFT_41237 [Calocera viscosa TUFC12733]
MDQIPSGPSASEIEYAPPRRLEPEPEDQDDEAARAEMEARMREFGIEDPKINKRRQSQDEFLIHEPSPSSSAPGTPPATTPGTPPTVKAGALPPRPPRRFIAPAPPRHGESALSVRSRSSYGEASTSDRGMSPTPLMPEVNAEVDEEADSNVPQIPEPPAYDEIPEAEQSNGHMDKKSEDFGIAH